jgi:hypothetical protein
MLAFGGEGKAVVARPCGGENSTRWSLKEAPGGQSFAKLIETVTPVPCAKPRQARTSLRDFAPATCTVSGAGSKAVNGNYTKTHDGPEGAVYSKDTYAADKLYQWKRDKEWKFGKEGKEVYYEAKSAARRRPMEGRRQRCGAATTVDRVPWGRTRSTNPTTRPATTIEVVLVRPRGPMCCVPQHGQRRQRPKVL